MLNSSFFFCHSLLPAVSFHFRNTETDFLPFYMTQPFASFPSTYKVLFTSVKLLNVFCCILKANNSKALSFPFLHLTMSGASWS